MWTHLDDGLGDEGVEVGHQFAVDVGHIEVLSDHSDEAHRPVTDPQVGVTQEWSYGKKGRTNDRNPALVKVLVLETCQFVQDNTAYVPR